MMPHTHFWFFPSESFLSLLLSLQRDPRFHTSELEIASVFFCLPLLYNVELNISDRVLLQLRAAGAVHNSEEMALAVLLGSGIKV